MVETTDAEFSDQRRERHRLLNHYEDFDVGRIFDHHWGRTITEAEAIAFATENMLHEPALFNRPYAKHLGYPDLPVSSFFVYALILGLSVEDLSEAGGPFLGSDDVIFHLPVFPGDTLFGTSRVLSRRLSNTRKGYGIVEWHTAGRKQNGAEVISFRRKNLVPCRYVETWQVRGGE
jgi:itaconyl-CoA hydratase